VLTVKWKRGWRFFSQNAWIKCYINYEEVALSNPSMHCLNQYLYANPTGFMIVFGYTSRYTTRYHGMCRNDGDFVVAGMIF
jgi:hypothetical protein